MGVETVGGLHDVSKYAFLKGDDQRGNGMKDVEIGMRVC